MAKFELNYNHGDYGKRIVLSVELSIRPSKEDYQTILDAVEKLSQIQEKYLPIKNEKVTRSSTKGSR